MIFLLFHLVNLTLRAINFDDILFLVLTLFVYLYYHGNAQVEEGISQNGNEKMIDNNI